MKGKLKTMPRPAKTIRRVTNPPTQIERDRQREDARDMAFIQRNQGKFWFVSWNKLMRELGYDDLQTPDRR